MKFAVHPNGGTHCMFANIGPRATEPADTVEDLLLVATMAVYQGAGFPGIVRAIWDDKEAHARRAFAYLAEISEKGGCL